MQLINYIEVLRIKQWLKNLLILFPAFFSLSILKEGVMIHLFILTLGFSLIASSIYIFNDLSDITGDQLHPDKKHKPITSGKISKGYATVYGVLLFLAGLTLCLTICKSLVYLLLAYVFINIIYSLWAKHIPILDILLISSGFLIRIYIGGIAIGVAVSGWLASLIFLMSVFILLAKRKDDVLYYQNQQKVVRRHIHFYEKLNFSIALNSLSLIILFIYSLYTFSEVTVQLFKSTYLWVTIPIAAIGLFSFTTSVIKTTSHFEPISLILKNKIIVLSLIIWFFLFGWLIYG